MILPADRFEGPSMIQKVEHEAFASDPFHGTINDHCNQTQDIMIMEVYIA